MKNVKIRDL